MNSGYSVHLAIRRIFIKHMLSSWYTASFIKHIKLSTSWPARDRVKTMVSRTHSPLDGHPKIEGRRATLVYPA